jgi:hypothetical protein
MQQEVNRVLGIVLLFVIALTGCQSSGHDRVAETATQLDALCVKAEAVKAGAISVSAALNDLVARADVDPKPAFEFLHKSAKAHAKSYQVFENGLAVARTDADKMFAEWNRNWLAIEDEDLKEKSYERRKQLTKAMADALAAMQPVAQDAKNYVSATNDLVTYLDQDLTSASIRSTESRAKSHAKSARSIGEKVDDAVETTKEAARLFETSRSSAPKR